MDQRWREVPDEVVMSKEIYILTQIIFNKLITTNFNDALL